MRPVEPAGWLAEVKRVLEHVQASDATELEFARPGLRLRVKRRLGLPGRPAHQASELDVEAPDGVAVLAPLTGVFYRASSPTAAPFVNEGDQVQPETVVGLIEAMKIFNEVLAERRGRLGRILVESGQLVQAGDRLMLVDELAGEVEP